MYGQQLSIPTRPQIILTTPKTQTQYPPAIMHASIVFTTVALATTAIAGPLLETRACPTGPYKEGSSCGEDCLGALKCSDNLYDVVRTTSSSPPPVQRSFLFFFPLYSPSLITVYTLSSLLGRHQHSFPSSALPLLKSTYKAH